MSSLRSALNAANRLLDAINASEFLKEHPATTWYGFIPGQHRDFRFCIKERSAHDENYFAFLFFSALKLAQRAFVALEIAARAAADITRLGPSDLPVLVELTDEVEREAFRATMGHCTAFNCHSNLASSFFSAGQNAHRSLHEHYTLGETEVQALPLSIQILAPDEFLQPIEQRD
jgi:hypothetical protein